MPEEVIKDSSAEFEASEDKLSHALRSPIARFGVGAVVGAMPLLVWLSYVWYFGSSVTAAQLWGLGVIAIGCGSGGAIWGTRFLVQLMNVFEKMPSL